MPDPTKLVEVNYSFLDNKEKKRLMKQFKEELENLQKADIKSRKKVKRKK